MSDERIDDGGPAFAVQWTDTHEGTIGMTKREWFAGQIMAGLSAFGNCGDAIPRNASAAEVDTIRRRYTENDARFAVQSADALIAELRKGAAQ